LCCRYADTYTWFIKEENRIEDVTLRLNLTDIDVCRINVTVFNTNTSNAIVALLLTSHLHIVTKWFFLLVFNWTVYFHVKTHFVMGILNKIIKIKIKIKYQLLCEGTLSHAEQPQSWKFWLPFNI